MSEIFGSRDGGIEILTMIGVQKCQFLAKSMVAYFCHHFSDNYVDLSDLYADLSIIYVTFLN